MQVMLDRDLAVFYDVETRTLNQAVKRNIQRFPYEFCFQLTKEEYHNWISQFVISNFNKMGLRRAPTHLQSRVSPCFLQFLKARWL